MQLRPTSDQKRRLTLLCRVLLLLVVIAVSLSVSKPWEIQAEGQRCNVNVQKITSATSVDRWWVWPAVGYFNYIAEKNQAFEFIVWDGGDGFYYATIQASDSSICKSFQIIYEAAGYEVF